MSAHIAQIKTATAAAIQRLGGLEAAATVCCASFQTLGGYQNQNRPDLIIPLDVALELDAACGEPVILSALARMQGFMLTAPERVEKPQIDTAMAQIAGGAGALLATSGATPQRWWARWNEKRIARARYLYANDPRAGAILLAEVNAIDADVLKPVGSWRQLQSHMTYYKVQRHPDANIEALKRRAYTGDAPTIVAIREGVAAGKTFRVIAQALGRSAGTVERLAKQHGIAKAARASKPPAPKPVKVRQVPPPVVLHTDRKPTPPRVAFETVEAYLAAGGKITRCPTVALLETQAEIPHADMAAVQAYYAAKPQGNWRAQRVADWKKAKREGRA